MPLFFVVTPANCNDGPLAIPMFMAVLLYHLRILVVRADAAYFNYKFLGFVRSVLGASVNVDYKLRRQRKRFLADLFFIRQLRIFGTKTPGDLGLIRRLAIGERQRR
jgi:hypothetical protein